MPPPVLRMPDGIADRDWEISLHIDFHATELTIPKGHNWREYLEHDLGLELHDFCQGLEEDELTFTDDHPPTGQSRAEARAETEAVARPEWVPAQKERDPDGTWSATFPFHKEGSADRLDLELIRWDTPAPGHPCGYAFGPTTVKLGGHNLSPFEAATLAGLLHDATRRDE